MVIGLSKLRYNLQKCGNARQAKLARRFFKTGPGQYAQDDIFLGVQVPKLRSLGKQYAQLSFNNIRKLLKSPLHEERLLSLLILMLKYRQADLAGKEKIYKIYLKHTGYINNWDLVDVTAKHIVGDFLADKDRKILYKLAVSDSLWERRIAILSTWHFIENNDFKDTLKIAEILLGDQQDLIHKAVGWMLREVGKRNLQSEEKFLKKYAAIMPRTMLRYAIERFGLSKRRAYLRASLL